MGALLGAEDVLPAGPPRDCFDLLLAGAPVGFPDGGTRDPALSNPLAAHRAAPFRRLLPFVVIAPTLLLAVGTGLYIAGLDAAGASPSGRHTSAPVLRGVSGRPGDEHRGDCRRVAAFSRDARSLGPPPGSTGVLHDAAGCAGLWRVAGPASDRRVPDERPFQPAGVRGPSTAGAHPASRSRRAVRRRGPPGDGTARRHTAQSACTASRAIRSRSSCCCLRPLSSSHSSGSAT